MKLSAFAASATTWAADSVAARETRTPPAAAAGNGAPRADAAQQPAASSWAADLAEADAEVSAAAKARPRPDENGAPAAKKLKPAAAPKSKAALPLKKGQTTMMGFFAKPK